jgi:hypothetical protein
MFLFAMTTYFCALTSKILFYTHDRYSCHIFSHECAMRESVNRWQMEVKQL